MKVMQYEAFNPSFFSDMCVENDTLRAFCCDSLFQNERAEQQKCAEKPIDKVRRTLPRPDPLHHRLAGGNMF